MPPTTRSGSQPDQKESNSESKDEDVSTTIELSYPKLPVVSLKGYKITDNKRSRRFGIGARNLQELKAKAKARFEVNIVKSRE